MPDYLDEFRLFTEHLEDGTGPDNHVTATTENIYASAVYNIDYGIERDREHRPGDISAVPVTDDDIYGLRIEIAVDDDFPTDDMERMLEEAWNEDRYGIDTEIDSVKDEYGQLLNQKLPRIGPVLQPVLDAVVTAVGWEEEAMTHGQVQAYTVADHGPKKEKDLPAAEKTTIGLMDWDRGRYVRILPEDRTDTDRGLEAAERIASWLDSE